MKQSTFKADHYPIRTIPVSFSVIFLAILNESLYSKELHFVPAKKKHNKEVFPFFVVISVRKCTSNIQRFALTPDPVEDPNIKAEVFISNACLRWTPYTQIHSQQVEDCIIGWICYADRKL